MVTLLFNYFLYLSIKLLPFLFNLQIDIEQSKVHEELVGDYTAEHAGTKDGYVQLPIFSYSA